MNTEKPRIKAVTFDLWETLLLENNGNNSRRIFTRCTNLVRTLNKYGVSVSVAQVHAALKALSPWLIRVWKTNKDVTHLDQLRFILNTVLDPSISMKEDWLDELSSAYISPLFEVPPHLNPDSARVLNWLKDREKLVGLICNTGRTPGFAIRTFLENEGVAEYFDLMLYSDEVGIRKPDPKIFQIALKKLMAKPHEVIHVGDNLMSDVWGAQNAGLKAIYLSTEMGKDTVAENDPHSLVSFSRHLGNLKETGILPDRIISSLNALIEVVDIY